MEVAMSVVREDLISDIEQRRPEDTTQKKCGQRLQVHSKEDKETATHDSRPKR